MNNSNSIIAGGAARAAGLLIPLLLVGAIGITSGCRTSREERQNEEFFTSGSREADQRASQRMAKAEQLAGSGEGAGERERVTTAEGEEAPVAEGKVTLFERLGAEQGLIAIVDDFTERAMADPRVNWSRKGVERGGLFQRWKSVEWESSPEKVERLKKHLVQFLAVATGGPPHYEGKEIKSAHAHLRISNAQFDATIGDLKASLDKLQVPNQEQKELLAIIESTRPQIVTER